MTIEEVITKKEQLAVAIRQKLFEFHKETKCKVMDIQIESVDVGTVEGPESFLSRVNVIVEV